MKLTLSFWVAAVNLTSILSISENCKHQQLLAHSGKMVLLFICFLFKRLAPLLLCLKKYSKMYILLWKQCFFSYPCFSPSLWYFMFDIQLLLQNTAEHITKGDLNNHLNYKMWMITTTTPIKQWTFIKDKLNRSKMGISQGQSECAETFLF